ncbi:MAG: DUF899 family protein [Solirubrobacteraceae bacterium]
MGWEVPWCSARESLDSVRVGRRIGRMHIVCYPRDGDHVFETCWTTRSGAEAMDYGYALMDLTVYGRQESFEDSPPDWPRECSYTRTSSGPPAWTPISVRPDGRPIVHWSRIEAGRSDELGNPVT